MKIKAVCTECGSENVRRAVWSEWSVSTQEWVISNYEEVGDEHCNDCGSATQIEDIIIPEDELLS